MIASHPYPPKYPVAGLGVHRWPSTHARCAQSQTVIHQHQVSFTEMMPDRRLGAPEWRKVILSGHGGVWWGS